MPGHSQGGGGGQSENMHRWLVNTVICNILLTARETVRDLPQGPETGIVTLTETHHISRLEKTVKIHMFV